MTTFSQPFSLTASTTIGGGTAPSQAAAAGFNRLAYTEDFTDASKIAPDETVVSGYNVYVDTSFGGAGSFQVLNTSTAAQISNGNTSGGANASPAGGVLWIKNSNGNNNSGFCSYPDRGTSLNQGFCWQYGYVEGYFQFAISGANATMGGGNGFPAFWSWTAENIIGNNAGQTVECCEVDFFEYSHNAGLSTSQTIINHTPSGTNGATNQAGNLNITMDAEWHTYGMLWTNVGGGQARMQFFFDNQPSNLINITGGQQGYIAPGSFLIGTGTQQPELSNFGHLYWTCGTGNGGWPLYCDWVRVWTA